MYVSETSVSEWERTTWHYLQENKNSDFRNNQNLPLEQLLESIWSSHGSHFIDHMYHSGSELLVLQRRRWGKKPIPVTYLASAQATLAVSYVLPDSGSFHGLLSERLWEGLLYNVCLFLFIKCSMLILKKKKEKTQKIYKKEKLFVTLSCSDILNT